MKLYRKWHYTTVLNSQGVMGDRDGKLYLGGCLRKITGRNQEDHRIFFLLEHTLKNAIYTEQHSI